jgi:hypothetical protein
MGVLDLLRTGKGPMGRLDRSMRSWTGEPKGDARSDPQFHRMRAYLHPAPIGVPPTVSS